MEIIIPERFFNYRRRLVGREEFNGIKEKMIKGEADFVRATMGAYVITARTRTQDYRFIREDKTVEYKGMTLAYSEICKAILETWEAEKKGRKRKKGAFRFWKEDVETLKENRPAMYAKAGIYDDMMYVDIKGFYFNIYRRLLDARYRRNKYLGVGWPLREDIVEWLKEKKAVRNTLFGIMRTTKKTEYVKGHLHIKHAHNRFFNPQLANLIYDISQAIALLAIEWWGAVYFNTDGMIVRASKFREIKDTMEDLGFKIDIRYVGEQVEVRGIGNYGFFVDGELVAGSKPFLTRESWKDLNNIRIDTRTADWLLMSWKKLVRALDYKQH